MNLALNNNILEATEREIEGQLLPDVRADYMKIVVAGMKVAGHNGANGLLSGLNRRKDPVADCAIGAINLVFMMSKTSKGTMPMKAMIPAAMTLMLHALDLVDKAGIAKVGAPELARATHVFTNHLMAVLKITMPMLQTAATHVHGIMQDPTKMELINRKAGVVRAPGTSTPTDQEAAQ